MTGRLSLHVLDTARGRPAAGVGWELWRLEPDRRLLNSGTTNADGRTDAPLVEGKLDVGRYEIVYRVGDYFRAAGLAIAEPPFFDEVPVRFAVADPGGHYHVPLLVSPWAYSTYRGS